MSLRTHRFFLDWQKPVAEVAAEFFVREFTPAGNHAALDFSGTVVVVPTHESGRKFLAELVEIAEAAGKGVFPPPVFTPDRFLRALGKRDGRVAGNTESLFAMSSVLGELNVDEFPDLFPVPPPTRDRRWATGLAETLLHLRATLSDSPKYSDCAGVAAFPENPEPRRWADLARIEEMYRRRLAAHNMADANDRRRACAQTPQLPEGWRRICFIAVPDFSPLLPAALEKLFLKDRAISEPEFRKSDEEPSSARPGNSGDSGSDSQSSSLQFCPDISGMLHSGNIAPEIAIFIAAPESLKNAFDSFGRCVVDFWIQRELPWENFDAQVKLSATPDVFSGQITPLITGLADAGEPVTTLGLLDENLTASAERGIEHAGMTAHNPAGKTLRAHVLGVRLDLWEKFLSTADAEITGELLREPFFAALLAPGLSLGTLLGEWDALREKHLPDSLDDALNFAKKNPRDFSGVNAALKELARRKNLFSAGDSWPEALRELVIEVGASLATPAMAQEYPPAPGMPAGVASDAPTLRRIAEVFAEEIIILERLAPQGLDAAGGIALLLRRLALESFIENTDEKTVSMPGWLELLWDDSPHLILAGMNEGVVPETVTSDAFLPGGFRAKLGLSTNDERFARDVYFLEKMIMQRAGARGRIDAFVLQTNPQGEPLRPSRLLFLCDRAALPGRVKRLFSEPAAPAPEPAWSAGVKFLPPVNHDAVRTLSERIAVTKFADYLQCPFRFYLKNILGMQKKDSTKTEPDAREFGTAVHGALEAFGKDSEAKNFSDAPAIERFVFAQLESHLRKTYGDSLPLPVHIAADAAKHRLAAFARIQAGLRAEGWEILRTEATFADILKKPFSLDAGGAIISGKIDRIDFHPDFGLRIIDYKTSAKAVAPEAAHLQKYSGERPWPPAFAGVDAGGKTFFWKNLQLPLYRVLVRLAPDLPRATVTPAYFNLPKAVTETGVYSWNNYTENLDESASECARGILNNLRSRIFWPPNSDVRYDDFAELLSPSPEFVTDFEKFTELCSAD